MVDSASHRTRRATGPVPDAGQAAGPGATVIVPTRDRPATLASMLAALARDIPDDAEVIVALDGPDEESRIAVEAGLGQSLPRTRWRTVTTGGAGPAAARNAALEDARGPIALFLDDDVFPLAGVVRRHLEFHRRHPEPEAGLLGRVVPMPPLDASPLVGWAHEQGVVFPFGRIKSGIVPFDRMSTAHLSLKLEIVRRHGGFDASLGAAFEDMELASRMAASGFELHYDSSLVAEHWRPIGLPELIARASRAGAAARALPDRARALREPPRSSFRHRAAAACLTAAYASGARRLRPVREMTWRALCSQAYREAYWQSGDESSTGLRVGRRLAALALADPAAAGPAHPDDPPPSGARAG